MRPAVSVVVPTHNRSAMLATHLQALAAQTYPRKATEWVVVCDGCTDGSATVARNTGADLVMELGGEGPAAARNAGLKAATAPVACFLDDDIVPSPGWLEALVQDVRHGEKKIFHMGYCPHSPSSITTYLDRRNAAWYEKRIAEIRRPGYEPQWFDFFSGNFATSREDLLELGGFDVRFKVDEDEELGFRAFHQGWRIRFVPSARAEHHFHRDQKAYGRQAFMDGRYNALLVQTYPEAAPHVRIGIKRRLWKRPVGVVWKALALRSRSSLDVVEALASVGERLRMRAFLDVIYPLIWDGNYWRGVATA